MRTTTPSGARPRADRVRSWLALSETALGNASDRLNAINIFPVADGDTGTNMYQTVRAARVAVDQAGGLTGDDQDLGQVLSVAARAALDQARGNSGTLLAVMLNAMSGSLSGQDRLTAPGLALALERARTAAWAALSDPQEGTMLTVLGAAAEAAARHLSALEDLSTDQLEGRRSLGGALDAVADAAWAAVVQTEDQLQPLTEARVVDAGGMGLLLVLDALRASTMDTQLDPALMDDLHGFAPESPHIHQSMASGPGFELMCSISVDPLAAATLRFGLNELGDSVIMSPLDTEPDVNGAVRWRVHAHVEDTESALALLHEAGLPENLVVEALEGRTEAECSSDVQDDGRASG